MGLFVAWITVILLTFHWARVVWARTIVQLAAEEQRRRIVAQQQSKTLLDSVQADAGDADWSDPQAQARAEQFRTRAEQYEQQAQKAAAAGRTKEAEEAKANAEQWRQWAEAAAEALTRRP